MNCENLIRTLDRAHRLSPDQWERLFTEYDEEDAALAMELARQRTVARFGKRIWFRGIVEFSNICKCDCYYCGIRCSNHTVARYRLTEEDILRCCAEGYEAGFRTFVLQGGEDGWFTDERMCGIIRQIKEKWPDCAVTLSLGERSRESYQAMFDAGADRYLLRHETADEDHYARLHPAKQTLKNRLRCLHDLKQIGYQTGCGFLVGDQTPDELAKELKFLEEFQPDAVELVPLGAPSEKVEYLISLIRLLLPEALIVAPENTPKQILAGANVVTQSLIRTRRSFPCCGGNRADGPAAPETMAALRRSLAEIGFEVTLDPDPWNG